MKPTDLPRELFYPFTEMPVFLAMLVFWLLGTLASAAGILGIWLSLIILPAFFRAALNVLEARAHGRTAPVVGGELFSWAENSWSLFPLIVVCTVVWGIYYLAVSVSTVAAWSFGLVAILVFPASLSVLVVTRSPLESLNPAVLLNMVRSCGWSYLFAPVVITLVGVVVTQLLLPLLPHFLHGLFEVYLFFLLFSLTGAVVPEKTIAMNMRIPDALELSEESARQKLTANRRDTATHAYGFVSRGNRAGGLAHIQSHLECEEDRDEASNWFFNEMLKWENTDAALFFAQTYLHFLLAEQRDSQVLKILSQCFHANPDFRPAQEDREVALELVKRYRRSDLLAFMREG